VLTKPVVALVVIAFDRGVFDRPVHPFDLSIGPWMVRFGQSMIDTVLGADQFE